MVVDPLRYILTNVMSHDVTGEEGLRQEVRTNLVHTVKKTSIYPPDIHLMALFEDM